MTFKLVKRRYRSNDDTDRMYDIEYFNHPYSKENSIRLIDDVEMDESLSLISLASEFLPADDREDRRGEQHQKKKKKEKKKEDEIFEEAVGVFDMGNSFYMEPKAVAQA